MSQPLIVRLLGSHLTIAAASVASVGLLAFLANQRALVDAAHDLDLAVVNQLREVVEAHAQGHMRAIARAEKILSDPTRGAEPRRAALRALVADGELPFLAIHRPDGRLDSLVWAGETRPIVGSLPRALREAASEDGAWVSTATTVLGARPWRTPELVGYLATALPAEVLTHETDRFRSRFLGKEGRVEIASALGAPLAASGLLGQGLLQDRIELARKDGRPPATEVGAADEYDGPNSQLWLRAFLYSPSLECWFVAAQPRVLALAPVYRLRTRLLFVAMAVLLIAGLVGLLLSRSLSLPITELAERVHLAAQAQFAARLPERGALELVALAKGFNDAVDLLARRRQELQSETKMRMRLSRYLSAQDLQEVFSRDREGLTLGAQSHLFVDLVPKDESEVAKAAPDRLVLFLGELFGLAAQIIERNGGVLDERHGDMVVGSFTGPRAEGTASAALSAAREILNEGRVLSGRWSEALATSAQISAGLTTAKDGEGKDLIEQAGLLQQDAKAFGLLTDPTTARCLGHADSETGLAWVAPMEKPTK